MKKRDIVIGLVVLLLLAGVIYWKQKTRKVEEVKIPQTLSIEDTIEEKFKVQIPENVEKAELKDVSGGNASGIVTRKYEEGTFELAILTDLEVPAEGSFYQGWISQGEEGSEDYKILSVGTVSLAKGGYLLDFKSSTDYSGYNQVIVSLEKTLGSAPDKHILEGSF